MVCNLPHQNVVVTLHNDPDTQDNPDFVYTLPRPIEVPRGCYDVGLLDFRIFKPVDDSHISAPVPPQVEPTPPDPNIYHPPYPFFTNAVDPTTTYTEFSYEKQTDILGLMDYMTNALSTSGYPLELRAEITDDDRAVFDFIVNTEENQYILLPEAIAEAFGFRRRVFAKGRYASEFPVSISTTISGLNARQTYDLQTITFTNDDDNLIIFNRHCAENTVIWHDKDESIETFLSKIVNAAKALNYDVEFELSEDTCTLKFETNSKNTSKYIKLPVILCDLLHFNNKNKFGPGAHVSEWDYDKQTWANLKNKQRFIIEFGQLQEIKIPMKNPSGTSYPEVLRAINKALSELDYDDARPEFKVKDGHIIMEYEDDDIAIKLPPVISTYFNIPTSTFFVKTSRYPVRDIVREEEIKFNMLHELRSTKSRIPVEQDQRYATILIDIIENQPYGNQMVPVLDQFPWDFKSDMSYKKNSVIYLPLNCDVVSQIRVSLTNEVLQLNPSIKEYNSILRLHFRPRFCCL